MRVVNPPQTRTVAMTMISVVVKISCLASLCVFLIARAKAMAPRSPANTNICWKRYFILLARPKFSRKERMYMLITRPANIAT